MAASELYAKKKNDVCRQPNYEHGFFVTEPELRE